jgi:hypothetical protein
MKKKLLLIINSIAEKELLKKHIMGYLLVKHDVIKINSMTQEILSGDLKSLKNDDIKCLLHVLEEKFKTPEPDNTENNKIVIQLLRTKIATLEERLRHFDQSQSVDFNKNVYLIQESGEVIVVPVSLFKMGEEK